MGRSRCLRSCTLAVDRLRFIALVVHLVPVLVKASWLVLLLDHGFDVSPLGGCGCTAGAQVPFPFDEVILVGSAHWVMSEHLCRCRPLLAVVRPITGDLLLRGKRSVLVPYELVHFIPPHARLRLLWLRGLQHLVRPIRRDLPEPMAAITGLDLL